MVTESNPIGYFEFNKVPAGSWEIHEIAPPEGFVLNEESFYGGDHGRWGNH